MDKIGERAVIQYLHKKGLTPKDIHNDMVATLGKDAPSYATVKRWVVVFKRGRQSLEDDPRPGRPVTVAAPEMVIKVHDIVMTDRRVTERYIASTVSISQKRVHSILTEDLEMRKLPARRLPRLLTRSTPGAHYRVRILTFLRKILPTFLRDLSLWMKHGSITLPQRPNNNRNNGSTQAHPAKECKDCSISWEGYSLGFLGCRSYSADRLSPKRTNDQWYIITGKN